MPRFIHLNGPPGIGKSTLAQMYADDHPGVLNLDIDRLRTLIGGWRDGFAETGAIVRPVALSMAAAHLSGGRDVIMPQYLGELGEIARFEAVARDNGAEFREIVLMDSKEQSVARFGRRGEHDEPARHRQAGEVAGQVREVVGQVREVVEREGGPALLARMHDQLTRVLAARPRVIVVATTEGAVEPAYHALTAILGDVP